MTSRSSSNTKLYVVWVNERATEWSKSEGFETLEDCFDWLKLNNYGHEYLITRVVEVVFNEQ